MTSRLAAGDARFLAEKEGGGGGGRGGEFGS